MTEQHPSSMLTITRERYDEMANAGLNDEQITHLASIGLASAAAVEALMRLADASDASATDLGRLADALATPREHRNPRGITYTNRVARRAAERRSRQVAQSGGARGPQRVSGIHVKDVIK